MIGLLSALFASFIATLLMIRFEHLHSHISADSDLSGPQKFHKKAVPRIGGIGIALGLLIAILLKLQAQPTSVIESTILICAIPVFAIGLTEDLTKKISVRMRLLFVAIGALLAINLLNIQITKLDIPGVDYLLGFSPIAIVFAVFAVTGLSNAYNIIDGFNGLSSMVGMITLMALGYMSYVLADPILISLSFIMVAAILGFFVWNYPRGLIFLGDGGAYLIGFWIAIISIMLVSRHSNVSPWFALLVNGYPILETLFTIYRRKIHQGKSPGQPDGIHFHSLIFRRVLSSGKSGIKQDDWFTANARTSPYLWMLTTLAIIPAILWWQSTPILIGFFALYIFSYVWLYKRIVCFRTPRWMHPIN
ncbi:glycosyltransferase [Polynucleobacter sp. AP-Reno-20A-A9]|uniref:MraY family glycosyltransferase n=1 Tax=Polynucleobacter sp. AP-Reno-20A-A9 TaxID=2576925 RepID=UPI001C0AC4D2|nr:glycosyltransferase [Polynucleobacter sp. AP-Reno-20A-A9]MBU3629010.1 glycosyltransferase family 4 protein [Polynucleobacter sp. AP-Reno-20A-A9]